MLKIVLGAALLSSIAHATECAGRRFFDQDLQEWLSQHSSGLILVVSDGMPYSQRSIPSVAAEAKKRKMPLLILSDRKGSHQQDRCDAILASPELFKRGALRHYPSLFMVKNHALLPKVIPGIQTDKELKLNLDDSFKK